MLPLILISLLPPRADSHLLGLIISTKNSHAITEKSHRREIENDATIAEEQEGN